MVPRVAVIAFPGMNCEVESMRAVRAAGMEALYFRWNDALNRLTDIDAYFLPGGFSYEDRGRSGMVAARDPLMAHLSAEAQRGKAVIGHCNGAQVLVESGLIPLDQGLRMALARNAVRGEDSRWSAPGFLSRWVWIRSANARGRCATSDWDGVMHLPIAHGEGRFTTRDPDLISRLTANDQIAFVYCDATGRASSDPAVSPNGSTAAIAGICNPAGNVVALMPHPERTENGQPYFASLRQWIERKKPASLVSSTHLTATSAEPFPLHVYRPQGTEVFIETIIVNNEERTVEQAARRFAPSIHVKQWRYASIATDGADNILRHIAFFNPHKERAYLRANRRFARFDPDHKRLIDLPRDHTILEGLVLLRRDDPDTGATFLPQGSVTGTVYVLHSAPRDALENRSLLEVFCNPHSGTLAPLR